MRKIASFQGVPVIVKQKETAMEFNEELLKELTLLRQTLEQIAASLEDLNDTLDIALLGEDFDEEMDDAGMLSWNDEDFAFDGDMEETEES
jgi:hypothetical protein